MSKLPSNKMTIKLNRFITSPGRKVNTISAFISLKEPNSSTITKGWYIPQTGDLWLIQLLNINNNCKFKNPGFSNSLRTKTQKKIKGKFSQNRLIPKQFVIIGQHLNMSEARWMQICSHPILYGLFPELEWSILAFFNFEFMFAISWNGFGPLKSFLKDRTFFRLPRSYSSSLVKSQIWN